MYLKSLELSGFKSFAKKTKLTFDSPISAIVGPNGSGKSNVAESLRWVLGEQSMKSLRGKRGEDLIWNGSKSAPRSNKASVTINFDNSARKFNLDFDEISITREVHRDGVNEYSINGSKVRLKDVYELLSQVSLGASGHHIISQGEADRVLNASVRDRRGMIEDALGLKIFQYKKEESERKLEKTAANIKEAESLRREIAPHLKFLKKQIEQIERLSELKRELVDKLHTYFQIEEWQYRRDEKQNRDDAETRQRALEALLAELGLLRRKSAMPELGKSAHEDALTTIDESLGSLRSTIAEATRSIGRLEGKLELTTKEDAMIERLPDGSRRCRTCKQTITGSAVASAADENSRAIEHERQEHERQIEVLKNKETALLKERFNLSTEIEKEREGAHSAERAVYEKESERRELESSLALLKEKSSQLAFRHEELQKMKAEMGMIAGRDVLSYEPRANTPDEHELAGQADLRKHIERLRIRIEDSGVGGDEVLKEFKETTDRDTYLEKEITDLETSAASLRTLLGDLSKTIEERFTEGVSKINTEFSKFFSILFGGGTASLEVVREAKRKISVEIGEEGVDASYSAQASQDGLEDQAEWGIGVEVNLPRKKIRSLDMLSGGERALVSIALLFAMSQVNPPPFLVLDETDAALDEANSRKYGDMIETLAKHSQLILITHNRETMSRAHVLYGVTMTADSVSQLLSIKFDDATVYAK